MHISNGLLAYVGSEAPAFPSDKFYEDDLESPEKASILVQAVSGGFSAICLSFVKEEYGNLAGKIRWTLLLFFW